MENELIIENESKLFWKYLVPSMLCMLAVSAYSFVDTFVVGKGLGPNAVAAMGLGTPVVSILYALGFLLGSGGAVNYAVAKSCGEIKKANTIFSVAFFIGIGLWMIFAIAGNIWIDGLAKFLGATEGNHRYTVEYLRWIISLSGILILDLIMNNFIRNEGHPNISMIATVSGTGLNIVLDFLFVLGFKWGMSGAASATCLASIVSVMINCSYAIIKKTNLIPKFHISGFKYTSSIMIVGFGSFVLEGAVALISVVFLNYAGKQFGDAGVSAFSVIITLNLVVYSLLNGVAQAIQPLVSANYATNNKKRINRFVKYGLIASILLGIFFATIGELFTSSVVDLFVSNDNVIKELTIHGLQIYSFSFIFMAVSIIIGIFFQAETKAMQSLIVLLGRSAILPILALYILKLFSATENLWLAIPVGEAVAMIIAIVLYSFEKKDLYN